MASFCTSCGSDLSPDAAFCEECGKPVAAKPKPEVVVSAPESKPAAKPFQLKPGAVRLAAIALAVVLAGGGGAYFLLREAPLPEGEALAQLLNSDEAGRLERTCLKKFDYSKTPVNVAIHDNGTKQWLDLLVAAEIYSAPRRVNQSRGFFYEEFWQYEHAEAGRKAIKGNRLCFASGIAVDRVDYREIKRDLAQPVVIGKVTYRYADQAPWSKTDEARQLGPEQLAETHEAQVFLRLQDGKWERSKLSPSEMADLSGKQRTAQASKSTTGFLDQIFSIFKSSPESAVIGKWRTNTGLFAVQLEFKPDSMLVEGAEEKVSYRRDGDKIMVMNKDSQQTMAVIEIVSTDELLMQEKGLKFILKRDR